jgi:hypothetical protein
MFGGIEYHAGRSAEGPCPTCSAGVEHPGLRIAIGDQAVAVLIDDGTGSRETAAQTLVERKGARLNFCYSFSDKDFGNYRVSWTLSLRASKVGKYCKCVPFSLTFFHSFSMGL